MSFKIAIIGRPNVGKSTIFNRLSGTRNALVHNKPGLTRDRKEVDANIADLYFKLIDTAGLEKAGKDSIEELMMEQTMSAVDEADIILFTIDGRDGVTPIDEHFAKQVRRIKKPKILVVNKCESEKNAPGIAESYSLGFGDPVILSAEHGVGFGDLYDRIIEEAKKEFLDLDNEADESKNDLSIAIIGRPNAGKSTLFNAIVGENRSITSDLAGTTRDSVYVDVEYKGNKIKLVDTAGIRKKFRKGDFLEELSVFDSVKSLGHANIAVLLIDGVIGIDKIELHLADMIMSEGKGMVIAINKWDLMTKEERAKLTEDLDIMLDYSLSKAKTSKILTISAFKGKNINRVLPACIKTYKSWNKKISTSQVNKWLEHATSRNIPPICAGRRVKFKYATQIKSRPPTFNIHTSSSLKNFPDSYTRYLSNSLRDEFELDGVAIRVNLVKGSNPYAENNE